MSGTLNTGRAFIGAAGDSGEALAIGGGQPAVAITELWNGTSWTEVNDLNTAGFSIAGAGSATAALAFGGTPSTRRPLTETWNGTNWTETGDLNVGRNALGGAGSNSAALAFGGYDGTSPVTSTEEFTNTSIVVKTISTS